MSLKNMLKNAKVEPAHFLMNLGVGSGLNNVVWPRDLGMTWVAMITYKTQMRG